MQMLANMIGKPSQTLGKSQVAYLSELNQSSIGLFKGNLHLTMHAVR